MNAGDLLGAAPTVAMVSDKAREQCETGQMDGNRSFKHSEGFELLPGFFKRCPEHIEVLGVRDFEYRRDGTMEREIWLLDEGGT